MMSPLLPALLLIGLSLLFQSFRKQLKKLKQQEGDEEAQKIKVIKEAGGLSAKEIDKGPPLSAESLEVLYLAATQKEIRFNLATEKTTVVAPYPTNKVDYVQLTDASQLPTVPLDQMVLDDDLFYRKFAAQELMRPEYYEEKETSKRLYILLDVSPSMFERGERMPDGNMRDTWARGIVASLLIDAMHGKAEYLLRSFSSTVHQLRSATTPNEAEALFHRIVRLAEAGNGTDIGRAVSTATADIRKMQASSFKTSHILLITDGDDQCGLTSTELAKALQDDVKLHVVLIGTTWGKENPLTPYVIAKY